MGKIINLFKNKCEAIKDIEITESEEISIEDAKHWVCEGVREGFEDFLTAGKVYQLFYNETQEEYYFFDDQGYDAIHYLISPGRFI